MPFDVFISHSAKDKGTAEAVCAKLEEAKVRCWIAPRDINPGADWAESIIAALGSCRVMILIFSSHSNTSPQVRREVQRAFEKGLTVMPLRIEDVQPSASLEYYIGSVHWLDALTAPMERHIEKLVVLVKAFTEVAGQTEPTAQASATVPDSAPPSPAADFSEPQPMPEPEGDGGEPDDRPEPSDQSPNDASGIGVAKKAATKRGKGALIFALALLIAGGAASGWWFGIERPKREAERKQEAALAPAQAQQQEPADAKAHADEAAAKAQEAQAEVQRQQEETKKAEQQAAISNATKEHPWENSLGVRFVPVPGTQVLFSIWDTQVQDFREYARETGYVQSGGIYVMKVKNQNGTYSLDWELDTDASWKEPGFSQGTDHPVVGVSWEEAKAFCDWLTKKEQASGLIGPDQSYRLPTDEEWSAAVGSGKYPWGGQWPPPEGAGNYADDAFVAKLPEKGWSLVPGNDGYARTSPVGSFSENVFGLYDMGGNVSQWCEDWYRADMNDQALLDKFPLLKDDGGGEKYRVLRGASWSDAPEALLSSARHHGSPDYREDDHGFRCVLVSGLSSR